MGHDSLKLRVAQPQDAHEHVRSSRIENDQDFQTRVDVMYEVLPCLADVATSLEVACVVNTAMRPTIYLLQESL
jgi:hypothetical protein